MTQQLELIIQRLVRTDDHTEVIDFRMKTNDVEQL